MSQLITFYQISISRVNDFTESTKPVEIKTKKFGLFTGTTTEYPIYDFLTNNASETIFDGPGAILVEFELYYKSINKDFSNLLYPSNEISNKVQQCKEYTLGCHNESSAQNLLKFINDNPITENDFSNYLVKEYGESSLDSGLIESIFEFLNNSFKKVNQENIGVIQIA